MTSLRTSRNRAWIELAHVRVDAQSRAQSLETILDWARLDGVRRVHFCPAHLIAEARRSARVESVLRTADMVAADGMPLVWLQRASGMKAERVSGPDVMAAGLDHGRSREVRHFFYGSSPDNIRALEHALATRYPGARVVGVLSPPFRELSDADLDQHAAAIASSEADLIWIGLGSPKQDLASVELANRLERGVLLCVGAAFDFHSGRVRRAPKFMQTTGTEWLFRLASEPRRLWRRYLVGNAWFVFGVAADVVRNGGRLRNSRHSERSTPLDKA